MNKQFKLAMLVMWSIISVALIALLVYGIRTGRGEELVSSTFSSNSGPGGVQKEISIGLEDCDNINFDFSSENIAITVTNEDKIKIVEKASKALKENEKFICEKRGKSIEVSQGDSRTFKLFNFGTGLNRNLEVFIPSSYKNELNVETSSGNIKINGDLALTKFSGKLSSGNLKSNGSITADEAELRLTSGNITVKELLTKKYSIKASSGNIDVDSLSGSGDVKVTSGGIEITYKDIDEYATLEASSGNVRINLPKELSFEFDGECSSGNIRSSFDMNYKNKKGNRAEAKVGNGPYKKISARVTSGNININ